MHSVAVFRICSDPSFFDLEDQDTKFFISYPHLDPDPNPDPPIFHPKHGILFFVRVGLACTLLSNFSPLPQVFFEPLDPDLKFPFHGLS